ncbi:uncharacterized protein PF3D7_1120000-like isoform X2 [Montipora capricornis]|uniref:uncharacterized protein PF3D7_1120000-like isoform X2 n=1 Tax=Montipora capricornis TaxID=246305 RepID=UPI0035F1DB18
MEETIRDICDQLIIYSKEVCKMRNRIKELEEEKVFKIKELEKEVSRLRAINKELQDGEKQDVEVFKIKEFEEEVSRLRAINKELQDGKKQEVEVFKIKELEEEVSRLRAINKELQDGEKQDVEVFKIKELEEEVSKLKAINKELQDGEKQEVEDLEDKHFFDMSPWAVSGETEEEVRERHISAKLQTYKHQLATYVTSPLEVPEVKQDHLKTAVKLDILKTLSEHLEVLYIATREMVSETCKCSEDLKREFYDFAYHGLRADHDELVHTVKDLEDTVQEMSEEEKEELLESLKNFR